MDNGRKIPLASDVVTVKEAIEEINNLIEAGHLNEYTQICLIRAMGALHNLTEDAEIAEVRDRCGDD